MTIQSFSCSIILFLLLAFPLKAQIEFTDLSYRYVGPTRGGRVTAVEGVNQSTNIFYMGATGGGLWKTEDYGQSWKNLSDSVFTSPSIGEIAVYQKDPNIIYVGTGSDGLRSNVISGDGVYKSSNAGKNWKKIGLEKSGHIGSIAIHPDNPDIVYVAAIGNAFGPNKERGLFKTEDGGETWKNVLFISDTTGVYDVEFHPSDPNTIFATAWRAERKPWTIISGGAENGIYRSKDGGENWKKLDNGLPKLKGKIDLAMNPTKPNLIYALVEARDTLRGVYKSENAGEDFNHLSSDKGLSVRPFYYTNIVADPLHPDTLYVLATGYYKSTDGGKRWKRISSPHGDNHDLWINPNNPNLMIQSNDGGANVSHNGGKTWSTQYNQPTAELYQVEVDNQHPYWLYAGQQDNSAFGVPSRSSRVHQVGGMSYLMNVGGCETGPAVPNPIKSNIIYANCKGRFSVYNKSTGQEQAYDVGAYFMYGHNPADLPYRFQRVSPIHISPHNPNIIYHCSQYVHMTKDEGKTWTTISPDLTAFESDKQLRSGSPITQDITGEEFYSTIYSIRESPIDRGQIWVGANDGPVHVTTNGGKKWKEVTPRKLAGGGRVDAVEPSSHDKRKAYIAVLRYQLGDFRPYIYRTNNRGKTWQLITDGIAINCPVRVVREDPKREGLLYAGTDQGMFISFDDGASWQAFKQNMPVTPITDIKIHRDDIVLSTMGRGFWIMDDISALRNSTLSSSRDEMVLVKPRDTYRYLSASRGSRGSNNGPQYPSLAVNIDYYLPKDAGKDLRLEIRDERGSLIRYFEAEVEKDSTFQDSLVYNMDLNVFELQKKSRSKIKSKRGFHRFKWDMRHAGAWDKNERRRYEGGPIVSHGLYTAVLLNHNDTLRQTFRLKLDPRVLEAGIRESDVKELETLALKTIELLSDAKSFSHEVNMKVKEAEQKIPDSELHMALKSMVEQLDQQEGNYTQPQLNEQISYLYGTMRRADQKPGTEVYKRFDQLVAAFNELEAYYKQLLREFGDLLE